MLCKITHLKERHQYLVRFRGSMMHALGHLMRLRRACCHMALVRSSASTRAATATEAAAARKLPDAAKLQLLESLAGPNARTGCAVCGEVPQDPLVAPCGDVTCECALSHSCQDLQGAIPEQALPSLCMRTQQPVHSSEQ